MPFFFAIGFSLGRKTTVVSANVSANVGGNVSGVPVGVPAAVVRPSAGKENTQPAQSTDFSFYKSVSSNTTDSDLKPRDAQPQPTAADVGKTATPAASPAPASGGYFVQVAAVSREEDAESLVEALKKKQYPAFTANNPSADKFHHVQVGPYADIKDAEAMRARLIADGYNPILKK